MKIVVVGGTGLIGSKVVEALKQRGHEVVVAAPSTGVDTITGAGLAEALAGAEVVIDVSNSPTLEEQVATEFFQTSGRNIAKAEANAGVKHHLALSIVGTDRLQAGGYFRAKLGQEKLVAAAPTPYTVIHATQFFEFIRGIAQAAAGDGKVHLPPVHFQPIAAAELAEMIADAALDAPVNGIVEMAGPERFTIADAARRMLAHDGDPHEVIADPAVTYFGVAIDDNSLVPGLGARLGTTSFERWLANAPPPPAPRVEAQPASHA